MRKERSKIKRINVEYKTFYYKEVKGKQFNIIAILMSGYILNDFKQCSRANAKSKATIKPEKKRKKEEKENRAHTKRDTQKSRIYCCHEINFYIPSFVHCSSS